MSRGSIEVSFWHSGTPVELINKDVLAFPGPNTCSTRLDLEYSRVLRRSGTLCRDGSAPHPLLKVTPMFSRLFVLPLLLSLTSYAFAIPVDTGYLQPPDDVIDLVDMAPPVDASPSPDGKLILMRERPPLPLIADLAAPELRLAGVRFNPDNRGPSVPQYFAALRLQPLQGEAREIDGLPDSLRVLDTRWSPDGKHIAVLQIDDERVSLWRIDVAASEAQPWGTLAVNAVWGMGWGRSPPMEWASDSESLVLMTVPDSAAQVPERESVPRGPIIVESRGRVAPTRTFQDLLSDRHDEQLFVHYFSSQLTRIALDGSLMLLGEPALISAFAASPDGKHLLVTRIIPPFSYAVPWQRFAHTVDVWSDVGEAQYRVVEQPLADNIPIAFDAVIQGRRSVSWRNDADATLIWVEAADGGDPANESDVRDRLFQLAAPFSDSAQLLLESSLRVVWTLAGDADTALIWERWWATRSERVSRIAPGNAGAAASVLWERSYEDRYADPGLPISYSDTRGQQRLIIDDGAIYLSGQGASPEGNQPFVDRRQLASGETERLWQSVAPYYEQPFALLDVDSGLLLTQREAVDDPPEFHLVNLESDERRALTRTEHPLPELKGIHRELVSYPRGDGVMLSATLLLPTGYDAERDGPLPTVIWAYPREFLSADSAGQLADSPYRFNRLSYWSAQWLATQGFAVLDNATMPVVGGEGIEPNDLFIEQITMNAEAAIGFGVERGVTDPKRVAIGGHSYGAFMTTSLLAHTDLFRTGIARSGAYNRSLTPFGFQSEQRTLWDDPQLYMRVSPFFHAHKISAPILIIHGAEDNNSGTYPMQSDRLYQAIKGLGGSARYVTLPLESHGYRARESVLHMLHETLSWLHEHLAEPEATAGN